MPFFLNKCPVDLSSESKGLVQYGHDLQKWLNPSLQGRAEDPGHFPSAMTHLDQSQSSQSKEEKEWYKVANTPVFPVPE